ncbi:MAG: UPF0758 domain-containing protein, partial [Myxococcota bacterium]
MANLPRERLDALGPEALSDAELLALLLRTGVRGTDVLSAAARLLTELGGLPGLARVGAGDLVRCAGVGPAKSATLRAAVE